MMPLMPTPSSQAIHAAHNRADTTAAAPMASGFSALLGAAVDAAASPTAPSAGVLRSASRADAPKTPAPPADDTLAAAGSEQRRPGRLHAGVIADPQADAAADADTDAGSARTDAANTNTPVDAGQAQQAVDAMLSLLQPGQLPPAAPTMLPAASAQEATDAAVAAPTAPQVSAAAAEASMRMTARAGRPDPDRLIQQTATDVATSKTSAIGGDTTRRAPPDPLAQERSVRDQSARSIGPALASPAATDVQYGRSTEAVSGAAAENRVTSIADIAAAQGLSAPPAETMQPQSAQAAQAGLNATAATPQAAVHVPAAFGSSGWPQAFGQQVLWSARQQLQSASLTLNPPELGPVRIELQLTELRASAQFSSPQADVRQAIEQALPQLKDLFASAGLELQQASVDSGQSRQQERQEWQEWQSAQSGTPAHAANAATPSENDNNDAGLPRTVSALAQRLLDTYA